MRHLTYAPAPHAEFCKKHPVIKLSLHKSAIKFKQLLTFILAFTLNFKPAPITGPQQQETKNANEECTGQITAIRQHTRHS